MGNMAEELAARIEADGGGGLAGGATGTRDDQTTPAPPAAEPSITDTGDGRGAPDTIPYARFREVNEQLQSLRPFSELQDMGYDADSLRRLVNFEANWSQDPVSTVATLVDNLDLPGAQKEAIRALMNASAPNGGETPNEDGEGDGMSAELKEALEYVRSAKQRDSQQETDAQLQTAVNHWISLDKKDFPDLPDDKLTPRHVVLMHIGALAGSGQYATLEELAEASRKVYMDERDRLLGGAVSSSRSGSPNRVPAGPPAATEAPKFSSLKEASKAALTDMREGRLPAMRLEN